MTIDVRTRRSRDVRAIDADELVDEVLPGAVAVHGDLAARGLDHLGLPALGLVLADRALTRGVDLPSRLLETRTGDVTVHCSDTLHRADPPVERPRQVVYSGFALPRLPGDDPMVGPADARAARAALSDVQSRIEAADNDADPRRSRAGRGR